jgi:hypothetical protein
MAYLWQLITTKLPDMVADARRDSMPQMAAAARDFLAIPASEVAVERLFSRAGDLIGDRRGPINGETMRILMLMEEDM